MRRTIPFLVCLVAAGASAQNNRSFVATFGSDANDCTPGNECRSFTRAMAMTNSGGEIVAINSGGFGAFTISQAVTVTAAPGAYAAITALVSHGITINAGTADRVVLRGLNIVEGSGFDGVEAFSFGSLLIDHCTVTGGNYGIFIAPASDSPAVLADTSARSATFYGFVVMTRAALIRCRVEKNMNGFLVQDNTLQAGVVSAVDFVSAFNTFVGAHAICLNATHSVALNFDRALITGNGTDGIFAHGATGGVDVRVTNSTVSQNVGFGLRQTGSAILGSMKNNMIEGNLGGDSTGIITTLTGK